jgi:hypothetical protein
MIIRNAIILITDAPIELTNDDAGEFSGNLILDAQKVAAGLGLPDADALAAKLCTYLNDQPVISAVSG